MPGRKFIVSTRPSEKFTESGKDFCVGIVNVPLTKISEVDFSAADIEKIDDFDPEVVVFTSQHGVDIYFSGIESRLQRTARKYYGVGPSTCSSVKKKGYECAVPDERNSHGLGELISSTEKGARVLLFRSGQANSVLDDVLSKAGLAFMNTIAYNVTRIESPDKTPFLDPDCAGIVFTSSMEAEAFSDLLKEDISRLIDSGTRFYSIGTYTTRAMKEHGIPASEPVGNSDFEVLIEEICRMHFT